MEKEMQKDILKNPEEAILRSEEEVSFEYIEKMRKGYLNFSEIISQSIQDMPFAIFTLLFYFFMYLWVVFFL